MPVNDNSYQKVNFHNCSLILLLSLCLLSSLFLLSLYSCCFNDRSTFLQMLDFSLHIWHFFLPILHAAYSELTDIFSTLICYHETGSGVANVDDWHTSDVKFLLKLSSHWVTILVGEPWHLSICVFKILLLFISWDVDNFDYFTFDIDFAIKIFQDLEELFTRWAPTCREEEQDIFTACKLLAVAFFNDVESFSFFLSQDALFLKEFLSNNLINLTWIHFEYFKFNYESVF